MKTLQFREGGQIEYVYTADGEKLKKRVKTSTVPLSRTYGVFDANQATLVQVDSTIYIGGLVLEQGESPKVLFHGGYATLDHTAQGGGTGLSSLLPTCHYYLTDHQGNVRMVVREDGTLEQINQYFPYGVPIHGHMGSGVQPYKYNGKELDRMHGIDLYDYGARMYDPTLGRFTTRDPMWEKYYHLSPYAYCGGDPVNRIDPDGRKIWIVDGKQKFEYRDKKLYTEDGKEYTGKRNWFIRNTFKTLNKIGESNIGSNMLIELTTSKNEFIIEYGTKNSFKPTNNDAAYSSSRTEGQKIILGGSGGTIKYNMYGTEVVLEDGSFDKSRDASLFHELYHGKDANEGKLDTTEIDGVHISEWNAIKNENIYREEMKMPKRTHHKQKYDDNNNLIGVGTNMLNY